MSEINLSPVLEDSLAQTVSEVARRIVTLANPQRILLFGSGVRGQSGPDSDLDFLVIVRRPVHRRRMEQQIYRSLHGIGMPVDVVVATEEDIARYGKSVGTIYRSALREGVVIYEA